MPVVDLETRFFRKNLVSETRFRQLPIRRWLPLLLTVVLLTACGRFARGTPTLDGTPTPAGKLTTPPATEVRYTPTPTYPVPANEATPWPTPVPTPTPAVPPMPIPTPSGPPTDAYIVQPGDTLSAIAAYRCGRDMEELAALNNIQDPATLQVGQTVVLPVNPDRTAPNYPLLPDSEVVYSPAYVDFDVAAFIREQGGYLTEYFEIVSGEELSAAEIVELVAGRYSVGPRALLALLEHQAGWVTDEPENETELYYPISSHYGAQAGLYFQLSWAAHHINAGYYDYKRDGTLAYRLADGGRVLAPEGLNAGTVGMHNVLARVSDVETWARAVSPGGFVRTYKTLFGDPYARAIEPLIPADLVQPPMLLPWEGGQTWYYSGGPHPAWGEGDAWAALDFAPPDVRGHCAISGQPATAAAAGLVLRSGDGKMYIDLDGDGKEQTGWVLFYLHVVPADRVQAGTTLAQGYLVGYPSCEGGMSDSSHLHIARRYNGEWIDAGGPVPMVLSGWTAEAGLGAYDGELVKGRQVRQACECWEDETNGLVSDSAVPDVGE
jgi:murein DD-endopeptidase MepM/ murein hydrolase activator NlpD